jgi:hypothetical protein
MLATVVVENSTSRDDAREARPDFTQLAGTMTDPKRLQYLLRNIYHLAQRRQWPSEQHWRQALMEACGFDKDGHLGRHVALVLGQIANRGYLTSLFNDQNAKVGYQVTDLGKRVVDGDFTAMAETVPTPRTKPSTPRKAQPEKASPGPLSPRGTERLNGSTAHRAAPLPPPSADEMAVLLVAFSAQVQGMADTGIRIELLRLEKEEAKRQLEQLQRNVTDLDAEEHKLSREMVSDDLRALIQRLSKVPGLQPGEAGAPSGAVRHS